MSLSQSLVELEYVDQEALDQAQASSANSGKSLWVELIKHKAISEHSLVAFFAERLGLPCVALDDYEIDPGLAERLSEVAARKHHVVPLVLVDGVLHLAMANPGDVIAIDEVCREVELAVEPVLASVADIQRAMDDMYGMSDVFAVLEQQVNDVSRPTAPATGDTRFEPRFKLSVPMTLSVTSNSVELKRELLEGHALDLSESGALIEVDVYLPKGALISLELDLKDLPNGPSTLKLQSQVIHARAKITSSRVSRRGATRLGVQFMELTPSVRSTIQAVISGSA